MAKLTVRYGAMNAGKSNRLINTAYNYDEQGLGVVTTMPEFAARESGLITSRPGASWPIDIAVDTAPESETNIRLAVQEIMAQRAVDVVLADEAQFYTPSQIDQLEALAKLDNTSVVAFCLRADVQRHLFTGTKRLFELADSIEKMHTMCRCGSQAEHNGRFVNGTFHVGDPVVMIDNDKSRIRYQSMCAKCYLEHLDSPGAITV